MSRNVKNLEQDKIKLKKIMRENEQRICELEQDEHVKEYINLWKKKKENDDLLQVLDHMIEVKRMDECNHLYVLKDANSLMREKGDNKKYPYCIKCGLDSSYRVMPDDMLNEKEQNMKKLCQNNEEHGIYGVPKGVYLSDKEGANIYTSQQKADEIYQEIIGEDSSMDDSVLSNKFVEKWESKKGEAVVLRKK